MSDIRSRYKFGVQYFCFVMESFDIKIIKPRVAWAITINNELYGGTKYYESMELREITDKFCEFVQEAVKKFEESLCEEIDEGFRLAINEICAVMKTLEISVKPNFTKWTFKYKNRNYGGYCHYSSDTETDFLIAFKRAVKCCELIMLEEISFR